VTAQQRGWWLEDATPGVVIRHPGGRTFGADEHPRLAWLTDNASDIHGDVHRATTGSFGQPLVLGALTAAVVIGLAEPAVAHPSAAALATSRGWTDVALISPVVAGDTIVATSRVEAVTRDDDGRGGLVRRVIEGRNQHDEVVVRIRDERWAPSRERQTTDC